MKKFRQKRYKNNSIKDINRKLIEEENCSKKVYDWIWPGSSLQHKAFGSQKNQTGAPTTKFFDGKMLMFAKLSLKNFVYEVGEIFFPIKQNETNIQQIYDWTSFPLFYLGRHWYYMCFFSFSFANLKVTSQAKNSGTYCLKWFVEMRSYKDLTHLTSFGKRLASEIYFSRNN